MKAGKIENVGFVKQLASDLRVPSFSVHVVVLRLVCEKLYKLNKEKLTWSKK